MLKLNRNIGEIVLIGDGAIMVLGVDRGQVSLGFDFPADTEIWRSELRHLTPAGRRMVELKQAHRAVLDAAE